MYPIRKGLKLLLFTDLAAKERGTTPCANVLDFTMVWNFKNWRKRPKKNTYFFLDIRESRGKVDQSLWSCPLKAFTPSFVWYITWYSVAVCRSASGSCRTETWPPYHGSPAASGYPYTCNTGHWTAQIFGVDLKSNMAGKPAHSTKICRLHRLTNIQ